MKALLLLIILSMASGCDRFPKDAAHTLDTLQNGELVAGYATDRQDSSDAFKKLAAAYAAHLHARLKWVEGRQSELVEMLKEHVIQMAAGGFESSSPYKKEVAFTKPYRTDSIGIGAAAGTPLPDKIEDHDVYVTNRVEAAMVLQKKGHPILVDAMEPSRGLVAGPLPSLRRQPLEVAPDMLATKKWVIAIPKGENAYLMDLEKFITAYAKHGQ